MGSKPHVPSPDSSLNDSVADLIGNRNDSHMGGTSIWSMLDTMSEHFHSASLLWPSLANAPVVSANAAAWTLSAAYTVLVATNAIPTPFDIHGVFCDSISTNDLFVIRIYAGLDGSETLIGEQIFSKVNANNDEREAPFQTPLLAAGTQIKCRVASKSGGGSIAPRLRYHQY